MKKVKNKENSGGKNEEKMENTKRNGQKKLVKLE